MTRSQAIESFVGVALPLAFAPGNAAGVRENGPPYDNRGAFIDQINKAVGVPVGSPWCASFVSYCGVKALDTVYPAPRTADCDTLLGWARRRKCLHTRAEKGDIFLVLNPHDEDDATHTGIVTTASSNGVNTIEGNTNRDGGREGWGVLTHTRVYSARLVFVRWAELLTDAIDGDEGKTAWKCLFGPKGFPSGSLPMTIINNVGIVDLSDYLARLFGQEMTDKYIGYDAAQGGALWHGVPLPSSVPQRIIEGNTFVGVRAITTWLGLNLETDPEEKTARVYRPL